MRVRGDGGDDGGVGADADGVVEEGAGGADLLEEGDEGLVWGVRRGEALAGVFEIVEDPEGWWGGVGVFAFVGAGCLGEEGGCGWDEFGGGGEGAAGEVVGGGGGGPGVGWRGLRRARVWGGWGGSRIGGRSGDWIWGRWVCCRLGRGLGFVGRIVGGLLGLIEMRG